MKNLKKLVSSVLAVALLAGSAVSLSCSANEYGDRQDTSSVHVKKSLNEDPYLVSELGEIRRSLYQEIDDIDDISAALKVCKDAAKRLNTLEEYLSKFYRAQKEGIKAGLNQLRKAIKFREQSLKYNYYPGEKKLNWGKIGEVFFAIGVIVLINGIFYYSGTESVVKFISGLTYYQLKVISVLLKVGAGLSKVTYSLLKITLGGMWTCVCALPEGLRNGISDYLASTTIPALNP